MFEIIRKDLRPARGFLGDFWRDSLLSREFAGDPDSSEKTVWNPQVDIEENDSAFVIRADLPGLRKEEINIEARGDSLLISGERKLERNGNDLKSGRRSYSERYEGAFLRTIGLPEEVRTEGITASYREGVLEVNVPKKEPPKLKKVTIN